MSNLQLLRRNANGVTYASPTNPDFTVRFKTTEARKSINGQSATNYVTEVIVNDDNPITLGGVLVKDKISIRIKISGAFESDARKRALLALICPQFALWGGENVLSGFDPITVPTDA